MLKKWAFKSYICAFYDMLWSVNIFNFFFSRCQPLWRMVRLWATVWRLVAAYSQPTVSEGWPTEIQENQTEWVEWLSWKCCLVCVFCLFFSSKVTPKVQPVGSCSVNFSVLTVGSVSSFALEMCHQTCFLWMSNLSGVHATPMGKNSLFWHKN